MGNKSERMRELRKKRDEKKRSKKQVLRERCARAIERKAELREERKAEEARLRAELGDEAYERLYDAKGKKKTQPPPPTSPVRSYLRTLPGGSFAPATKRSAASLSTGAAAPSTSTAQLPVVRLKHNGTSSAAADVAAAILAEPQSALFAALKGRAAKSNVLLPPVERPRRASDWFEFAEANSRAAAEWHREETQRMHAEMEQRRRVHATMIEAKDEEIRRLKRDLAALRGRQLSFHAHPVEQRPMYSFHYEMQRLLNPPAQRQPLFEDDDEDQAVEEAVEEHEEDEQERPIVIDDLE
ncbi:hypothetical protein M3Y99_00705600 [Aphelenchoides fujianensis]|nr:hypothetical protein M3Y99_00705600 [Aphelenchoides fujianensis]